MHAMRSTPNRIQGKAVAQQHNSLVPVQAVIPSVVCVCIAVPQQNVNGYHLEQVGSGVIVHPDGIIVTSSAAVTQDAVFKIVVYENSQFEGDVFEFGHNHIYDGEIVSLFPSSGVAVLKIAGGSFQTAALGNSDLVEQGDWCIMAWDMLGKKPMITSGIVCGANMSTSVNDQRIYGLFQISCRGGESAAGGVLLNRWGEITGIVIKPGFVLPSNKISLIIQGLTLHTK